MLMRRSSKTQRSRSGNRQNKSMKLSGCRRSLFAAAFFAIAASAAPALAVTNQGASSTPYVAAFAPLFGRSTIPHAGTMQLVVSDGTITGTYRGMSVGPDRLNDRAEPVIGTVSPSDGYMLLNIGNALSFTGTMAADGTISGTATYNGRLYEFTAKPGAPGHPYVGAAASR